MTEGDTAESKVQLDLSNVDPRIGDLVGGQQQRAPFRRPISSAG